MIETFAVHTSTVKPYTGTSGRTDLYGDPVTYPCLIEDEVRLVRDETGREVVSRTTIFYPPHAVVPVRSVVTIPGRTGTLKVIAVGDLDSGGLTDLDHLEVSLA